MFETVLHWVVALVTVFVGEVLQPDSVTYDTIDPVQAEVVKVIDGDTVDVRTPDGEARVRYIGIDTPEPYRDGKPACYSGEATKRNAELVSGKTVTLIADEEDTDRFGRLLRYVYVDDIFVNEVLIAEGYATTLTIKPNDTYATSFHEAEKKAKKDDLGLWKACI